MVDDHKTVSEERAAWLWKEQDALIYRVRISAAYNGRRERFFNVWERLLQAFTAITATAAFTDLAGKDGNGVVGIASWFAFAAAVASIVPLVLNLAGNAQRHGQLKSAFKSLLASMYSTRTELTEGEIAAFKAKVTEIEAGEPAAMPAVVIACQNEIAASEGKPVYPFGFWVRCWMHFYPFDGAEIVRRAEQKERKRLTALPGQEGANTRL